MPTIPAIPAQPYPRALAPYEIDFDRFWRAVNGRVQEMRALRNQLPLVPDGEILVGQEQLPQMDRNAPPMIVVVPRGTTYHLSQSWIDQQEPIIYWDQWLQLEVHCWGDDDPEGRSLLTSFSTSLELYRQFSIAMADEQYGPAQVVHEGAEWVQMTDTNRNGRVLVGRMKVQTFLTRDPAIFAPVYSATAPATPGTQALIAADLQSADGTSTVQEAVFVAP